MKNKYIKGNVDWYSGLFSEFEKNLNGQLRSPVHKIRRESIQKLSRTGYPTTKHEEWKYTNVTPVSETNFQLPAVAMVQELKNKDIYKYIFSEMDCDLVVFVNGRYSKELSRVNSSPDNIKIVDLKTALKETGQSLIKYLTRYPDENDIFSLLNTAFMNDGVYVKVQQGKLIDTPLHLLYLSSPTDVPFITQPRNIIVLEENSKLNIVETYAALDKHGSYFTNSISDIIISPNSQVEHYKIQLESEDAYHIYSGRSWQGRDSSYNMYSISLGAKLARNTISSVLDGEVGECVLHGLYIASGREHVDNHTVIDHAKPHCTSRELYRGILDNQSSGVFDGKIVVRPDAQKTNAIQSNNCILLSKESEINSKPQLEILADDVRCTHGATIGQLDDNAIFYMLSRGIDRITARNLLIYAFANTVLEKITIKPIKDKITSLFTEKLSIRILE
jgi:Fe-S cluster assembly protein SufD